MIHLLSQCYDSTLVDHYQDTGDIAMSSTQVANLYFCVCWHPVCKMNVSRPQFKIADSEDESKY